MRGCVAGPSFLPFVRGDDRGPSREGLEGRPSGTLRRADPSVGWGLLGATIPQGNDPENGPSPVLVVGQGWAPSNRPWPRGVLSKDLPSGQKLHHPHRLCCKLPPAIHQCMGVGCLAPAAKQRMVNYSGNSGLWGAGWSGAQGWPVKLKCSSENTGRLHLLSPASGLGSPEPVQTHRGGPSQEEDTLAQMGLALCWGWAGVRLAEHPCLLVSHSAGCLLMELGRPLATSRELVTCVPRPSGKPPQAGEAHWRGSDPENFIAS